MIIISRRIGLKGEKINELLNLKKAKLGLSRVNANLFELIKFLMKSNNSDGFSLDIF